MKIACITPFHDIAQAPDHFNTRLRDEFSKRGHEYVMVVPNEIAIRYADANTFPLHHKTINLAEFNMYSHALRAEDVWAWEVVDTLREWGKLVIRPKRTPHDDKVTMARLFTRAGIAVPRSAVASTLDAALEAANVLGYPVVGKARTGSQGRNVKMVNNANEMQDFVSFALALGVNFLLQEVIRPLGRDIRAFVVGNRVVAAMERFAADGDFRANYSISGKAIPVTLSSEEERVAIEVTSIYQAPYAGVDFVRTDNGPVVLEINKSPAVRGIEATTGINVCAAIVEYFDSLYATR